MPVEALAHIPDGLLAEDAAPLMCAGITTFNALRHSGAMPGDLVAIFRASEVWAIWVSNSQASLALRRSPLAEERTPRARDKTGSTHTYLDALTQNVSKELTALGGARVILATAPDGKAMGTLIDGLRVKWEAVLIGATPEPFAVSSFQLLLARKSIGGWPSGTSKDSEDTLKFAAAYGVRPMIETFPLDRVADAYEHMISGKVRFRSVLKM